MTPLRAPSFTRVALVLVFFVAGCSTGEELPPLGSTSAEPDGTLTTGLFDTVGITADYPVGGSSSDDGGVDDTSGDVGSPPIGCNEADDPAPLGSECADDCECASGHCLGLPLDGVCSKCTTPQECAAAPECPGGGMLCGMQCVNTDSNNDYCGMCFDQCAVGEVCSDGACQPGCGPGLILCPTGCADASSDPLNCGGCGIACNPMQMCNMGLCEGGPVCGVDRSPPGGACPPECTGGCSETTCTIDCASNGACDDATIVCPADFACEVICSGVDACDDAKIDCPPDYGCQVSCGGGHDACGDIHLDCGDGTCEIDCEADACSGAEVDCGLDACTATCRGNPFPKLNGCEGSCGCTPC
ncbi:hypothetical protein [Paraliomyxa miuraensis]|uniref:hypothetical protein n=1 Tax=Paraliomyxa miuraensis TaxID=376150 RepID=UPI00224EA449|nr:hypothetical protein [Paraliomyxa miuraensis]MCX4248115.1 hypothetical protein [Paraliomyxa miuraensis]